MKSKRLIVLGVLLIILGAVLLNMSTGQPTFPQFADHFGAPGKRYTIPVYIEDTYVPVTAMLFSVSYDKSRVKIVDVKNGNLTQSWDDPVFFCPQKGTCNINIVYGLAPIPQNSSGDVCILTFKTIGSKTLIPTELSFSNLQLSDTSYTVGTAPVVGGIMSPTMPVEEEYPAYWS